MVHFGQMRDLVGGNIVQHLGGRHDQPPRIHQRARDEHDPHRERVSRRLIRSMSSAPDRAA